MKFSVFCMAFLLSFTVVFAQVSKQSTQKTVPAKSAVIVKKSVPASTTDNRPANQIAPSTQKKPVTPVKPGQPSNSNSQNRPVTSPKDITGYWLTANKANIIQFYREGDAYFGKVVWTRQKNSKNGKPLTDVNNPDRSKRSNPIVGIGMVSNLRYNPKTKMYEGGKAYLPQNGRTFDCKAKLVRNNDAMEVTAMAGMTLMSKTLTWTRTTGIPSK